MDANGLNTAAHLPTHAATRESRLRMAFRPCPPEPESVLLRRGVHIRSPETSLPFDFFTFGKTFDGMLLSRQELQSREEPGWTVQE